jgi:hypothetical protein
MSWTDGYVADVGYIYGYYNQLNPLWSRLALLLFGVNPPPVKTACDLGFGQGLALAIHAAAQPHVEWWGTDFNPSQAAFAQELAEVAGVAPRFFDQSFAEFCSRTDLPDFDFIGVHGIWTWVSDENRAIIVDFVRRKLKVGGLLYVSYNTLPGWAETIPLRLLLTDHAASLGAPGQNTVTRIEASMQFANRLFELEPQYLKAHPQLSKQLETLSGKPARYLAHEYFNRDWHPMSFTRMAQWLEPAKLSYVCSAGHIENFDPLNLTDAQAAFLKDIEDPIFRETTRDFIVNRRFRRDYWVKGPRRGAPMRLGEILLEQPIVLVTPREHVVFEAGGALGNVTLDNDLLSAVLEPLSDHLPHTLSDVVQHGVARGLEPSRIIQAVAILMGKADVLAAQDERVREEAAPAVGRLNRHFLSAALAGGEIGYLASPVTGSGIPVGRFEQIFLHARSEGLATPQAWAQYAWDMLVTQGQPMVDKEGKVLATAEEALANLEALAADVERQLLPILRAQGIVED